MNAYCQESSYIYVEFGFEDSEDLISTLNEKGYRAKYGNECCDSQSIDEALGIWVGRGVPVEDAKKIILLALNSYPSLSYYKYFGEEGRSYPKVWDSTIYLGGNKWAAVNKTAPMLAEEARKVISQLSTSQDLEIFIKSLQNAN